MKQTEKIEKLRNSLFYQKIWLIGIILAVIVASVLVEQRLHRLENPVTPGIEQTMNVEKRMLDQGYSRYCLDSENVVVEDNLSSSACEDHCRMQEDCRKLFEGTNVSTIYACATHDDCLNSCHNNFIVRFNQTICKKTVLYNLNEVKLQDNEPALVYIPPKKNINDTIIEHCENFTAKINNTCISETNISSCIKLSEGWKAYCIEYYQRYPTIFMMEVAQLNITEVSNVTH